MAAEDLITGKDIAEAVLQDIGEAADLSGDYANEVRRYVRTAYWDILGRHPWPWALSPTPGVMTTEAAVRVTITAIAGDVVTVANTVSPSKAGWKFYVDANNAVYRISSHTSGTSTFTLDGTYVQTESSGPATLYQDEYVTVPDVIKIWDPFQVRGQWWQSVPILDKPVFEAQYGKGWSAGPAPFEACAEIHSDESRTKRIRFAPWSEEAVSLEYDYTKFHDLSFDGSGEDDTPRVPKEWRHAILELASFNAFLLKDDTKADQAILRAERSIKEMVDTYVTPQKGELMVRPRYSVNLGCV